jgi:hypothetical protein
VETTALEVPGRELAVGGWEQEQDRRRQETAMILEIILKLKVRNNPLMTLDSD